MVEIPSRNMLQQSKKCEIARKQARRFTRTWLSLCGGVGALT